MEQHPKLNFLKQLYLTGELKHEQLLNDSNRWGDMDYLELMSSPDAKLAELNNELLYSPLRLFGIGRGQDKYKWSLQDQTSMRMGQVTNQYISKLHGRYLKLAYLGNEMEGLNSVMIFPSPLNTENMYSERFIHDYISFLNSNSIYPDNYQLFLPLHEHVDFSSEEHNNGRKFLEAYDRFESQLNQPMSSNLSFIDATKELPFVDLLAAYGFHPFGHAVIEENKQDNLGKLAIVSFGNTNITGCAYCPLAKCRNSEAYELSDLYANLTTSGGKEANIGRRPGGHIRNSLTAIGGSITSTCSYNRAKGYDEKVVNSYKG